MGDVATEPAPMGGLFDEQPEQDSSAGGTAEAQLDDIFGGAEQASEPMGDVSMSQPMSDLPADAKRGGASPVAAAPGADSDVLRVVHELERRMGQLEAKLEESNEARDRLERQVAAQSEELRVQRAAIARTQRALRTMSRGDDDKATEPALRESDTQAKTRAVKS
jgi:hypothetical protein